jgi:putative ABC transport system substrate-binding protein
VNGRGEKPHPTASDQTNTLFVCGLTDDVNDRRLLLISGCLTLVPVVARAQKAKRRFRIGLLAPEPDELLQRALHALGYVEDRDVVWEFRNTHGRPELVRQFAEELAHLKVDVIVAAYPAVALAARRATATIPIVMMNTPDPVDLGLVDSLSKPGGNVTGVTTLSVELSVKQLELLKESIPKAVRMAMLWNPDNPWHPVTVRGLRARSDALGLQLQVLEVRRPDDFEQAFGSMATARTQAVLLLADPMTFAHRGALAELARSRGLPMMGSLREYAESGCLLSYWADRTDISLRSASYIDRILRGSRVQDLPIEQPTKYELIANLRTARALSITFPPSILLRADRVIE